MLFKRFSIVISILLVLTLSVVGCSGGDTATDGDGKEEIVIGKVPYPQEWIPANIIKHVAEERGYSVKMSEGDIGFIFLGLSQGDIDIYPDVWLPTLHKNYADKYGDKIELTGILYSKPDMGFAVPDYVDIDSIEELKGRADEFDGRIIGVEPSAGMMLTGKKTVEEYGLENYEIMEGSTPALLAELEKATKNNEPMVFLAWRPHTMFQNYDIKVLEDPKGVWVLDDVFTGVHPTLKDKAPDIYKLVQNLEVSIEDMEEMLDKMESEENTLEELTKEWLEDNREKIDSILK